ncbi:unnamed protein product [Ambrosiozyma monospora]|uniref:U3 small nucleolar RNA-associated protein 25 n=1 Tax=Ambrosiozyma monospora TaxID=43982 RepID=A0A9W7DF59_AMBMO|nr:unnamed protein product [Ambrosiozyma monospora]
MYTINDKNDYVTQLMLFSKYSTPEFNNVTNTQFKNLQSGVSIFKPYITDEKAAVNQYKLRLLKSGLIDNKVNKLRQVFLRFQVDQLTKSADSRFEFFKNIILSQIINKLSYETGTLVYIPSYIDYIRVKNYLSDINISAVGIDEYSSQKELTRNRFSFKSGKVKIMLYTERLHFYKRFELKGVRNVIFYGLPTDPIFYSEVLNFIVDNKIRSEMSTTPKFDQAEDEDDEEVDEDDTIDFNLCMIRVMFSKLDMMKLDKLVGLKLANELIQADSEINEI